jgi:Domain of unknown function (DUF4440)
VRDLLEEGGSAQQRLDFILRHRLVEKRQIEIALVLAPFFEGRQTELISTSPYAASAASHTCRIMAPGSVISDVSNCPFLILFAISIPLNVISAFSNVRKIILANRDWPHGLDCVGYGAGLHSPPSQTQMLSNQLKLYPAAKLKGAKKMRAFLLIVCVFLASPLALEQANTGQDKDAQAKEGLRKLYSEYNEAGSKRDRAALDKLFADGYVWVQGNGSVTTKTKHIDNILGNTSQFSLPAPSFEQLTVYGDMAILRATENRSGLFATTVFANRDRRWQFVHA